MQFGCLGLNLYERLVRSIHIRAKIQVLNARMRSLRPLPTKNSFTRLERKKKNLVLYKTLSKPIWTYGFRFRSSAQKSFRHRLQAFQGIALRRLVNAPPCVSNLILLNDLVTKIILGETRVFYYPLQSHLPDPLYRIFTPLHSRQSSPQAETKSVS